MKKLLFIAAVAAACSTKPPVIQSFTSDKNNVDPGTTVTLSWKVSDARTLTLSPDVGAVAGTSVTVKPSITTTYVLRAQNSAGSTEQQFQVTVNPLPHAAVINDFYASPAQVPAVKAGEPPSPTTLKWSVSNAAKIELTDPSGQTQDVTQLSQITVAPAATAAYTLKVTSDPKAPSSPKPVVTLVRVSNAPAITAFDASATSIQQGMSVTLTWDGNASSWSISDGATTTNLGPLKTLLVRPSAPTTYTLIATGFGGTSTRTVKVDVTSLPGGTLVYTAPTPTTEALKLVADSCATPCTSLVFHVQLNAAAGARGMALNIPVDPTKITVSGATTTITGARAAAAIGTTGPLKDMLVVGVAAMGNNGSVAPDTQGELASFTVNLKTGSGQGTVFDGANAGPGFVIDVRSSASNAGGIAIGKLQVN